MSDNIQVAIRVRPINVRESLESQHLRCIKVERKANSILISVNSIWKQFSYDYVGDEDTTQEEIFESIGKPISLNCLTGYNGTLFAYGQTGSGKTHTIIGPSGFSLVDKNSGILPRCLSYIFNKISSEILQHKNTEYLIKCTFLEIYNEQLRDLFTSQSRNLQIREDIKKGCYVEDLIQETVLTFEETLKCIEKGLSNRHVGATLMNKESSRSHSVFTLYIESKEKKEDVWGFKNSLFHVIDLAGSERCKSAGTTGDRLKEAASINKSLSTLGDVINSLVEVSEGKNRYIRYRDSKLTFLLKDSIGGNSKTCIIANISPSMMCYAETLSTLRFAERAKLVRNKAIINEDTTGTILELKAEVSRLKSLLKNSQNTFFTANDGKRVQDLEDLLQKNVKIRLLTESALQQEIETKENYIKELIKVVSKYESKLAGEKMIYKFKEENLKRLQRGERLNESQYINEMREEIAILRKENANHPVAAKYFVENDALKSQISYLENELQEKPQSLSARLKTNQEFTENLNIYLEETLKKQKDSDDELKIYSERCKNFELMRSRYEDQINSLVQEIDLYKSRISVLEDDLASKSSCNENTPAIPFSVKKEPMQTLDTNIKLMQKACFSIYTKEPPLFCNECYAKSDKIATLEEQVQTLRTALDNLMYCEEECFRLSEENKKIKYELDLKDAIIEEYSIDKDILIVENEALSNQLIEFSNQITEKNQMIAKLSPLKNFRRTEIENSMNMMLDQVNSLNQRCALLQAEYTKASQELRASITSREQLIEELKRLQRIEYTLQKECEELNSKLQNAFYDNTRLRKESEDLNQQIIKLSGHNNLSQKINYLAKMKSEYNTLKESNTQLREELRKKTEKIDDLSRKYEKLAKANGIKDFYIEEEKEKSRIEILEAESESLKNNFNGIINFLISLPFASQLPSGNLEEQVKEIIKFLIGEINNKQTMMNDACKELQRKESCLRLMENELLLYKQKNELNFS